MARNLRTLSVYEGFFAGGARILHSEVLIGLERQGHRNFVLSLNEVMRRDATVQNMRENNCYRRLTSSGIVVDSLRPYSEEVADGAAFSLAELRRFKQYASRADVILALKEQPLRLVNQVDLAGKPVVVCLHRSDPENQGAALLELQNAILSGKVAAAICCAESTRDAYFRAGIPADKLRVVTNGVDLRRFKPDAMNRRRLRSQLRIPQSAPVVVLAARYDRMKNIPLFLRSVNHYLEREPNAHVIMCGAGMNYENKDLGKKVAKIFKNNPYAVKRIHLLSIRRDVEAVYAAADVVALTSAFGEAYPLSLVEGMMCGAVPVTTDVGDSAKIVAGGRGILTSSDPAQIASAWQEAHARRRKFRAAGLRDRDYFSKEKMTNAYAEVLQEVYASRRRRNATRLREISMPTSTAAPEGVIV